MCCLIVVFIFTYLIVRKIEHFFTLIIYIYTSFSSLFFLPTLPLPPSLSLRKEIHEAQKRAGISITAFILNTPEI